MNTSLKRSVKPALNLFPILAIVILLAGCGGIKPGSVKSGKKLFESFFVGEDGTQYFIKPLSFLSNDSKSIARIDFTFRYKNEVKDSATVNFSIVDEKIFKSIDSISIFNNNSKVSVRDVKFLFAEKGKKTFNSRFSVRIPLASAVSLFDDNAWGFVFYSGMTHTSYSPSKKSKKSIERLKDNVFVLF